MRVDRSQSGEYASPKRLYTSESDVCRRQILTSKDGPYTERIKLFIMAKTHHIGIQIKQKELTKTFMVWYGIVYLTDMYINHI